MTFLLCALILLVNCSHSETIQTHFSPPHGFKRVKFENNSFSNYIQNLSIKKTNTILKHDGKPSSKSRWNSAAVIATPLMFKDNLEQCSDFCMRFWSDYHKDQKKLNKLFLFNYMGEKKSFLKSKLSYKKFLRRSFSFSNSYSLKRALETIQEKNLSPGDLLIQSTGHKLGHVSMIMDVAQSKTNQRVYLIGFSAIPAQEFHIESAQSTTNPSHWFSIKDFQKYLSKKIRRGPAVFKRF